MKVIISIEDKAFMGILLAAVEAYPSKYYGSRRPNGSSPEGEVHGLLFGQRIRKKTQTVFNVTLAVANQMVLKRSGNEISVSSVHIDRVREVTELFPTYSLLGYFHSHPFPKEEFHKTTSVEPSDVDIKDALTSAKSEGEEMLDLILGITRQERLSKITPSFPRPHIIHSCCGIYKYTLACCLAWLDEENNECYKPVNNLICPIAAGMQQVDLG